MRLKYGLLHSAWILAFANPCLATELLLVPPPVELAPQEVAPQTTPQTGEIVVTSDPETPVLQAAKVEAEATEAEACLEAQIAAGIDLYELLQSQGLKDAHAELEKTGNSAELNRSSYVGTVEDPILLKNIENYQRAESMIDSDIIWGTIADELAARGYKTSATIQVYVNSVRAGELPAKDFSQLIDSVLARLPKQLPKATEKNLIEVDRIQKELGLSKQAYSMLTKYLESTDTKEKLLLINGLKGAFFDGSPLLTKTSQQLGFLKRWQRQRMIRRLAVAHGKVHETAALIATKTNTNSKGSQLSSFGKNFETLIGSSNDTDHVILATEKMLEGTSTITDEDFYLILKKPPVGTNLVCENSSGQIEKQLVAQGHTNWAKYNVPIDREILYRALLKIDAIKDKSQFRNSLKLILDQVSNTYDFRRKSPIFQAQVKAEFTRVYQSKLNNSFRRIYLP